MRHSRLFVLNFWLVYSAKHREYQLVAQQGRSQGRGQGAVPLPPPPRKLECPLAGSGTVGLTHSDPVGE